MPNIALSQGLADYRAGNKSKGQQALFTAIAKHPWVIARLMQELSLDPPPNIWGKEPRTEKEKLYTELYATRAKDLWNTPENCALLTETASALPPELAPVDPDTSPISTPEARHVLLSDSPPLIALLPRSFTARMTSASDPLPPSDAYPPPTTATTNSRRPTVPGAGPQPNGRLGTPAQNLRELQGLYSFFSSLFPWFNPAGDSAEDDRGDRGAATGLEDNPPQPPDEETVAQRIRESGVSEEVVVERTQRMMVLQAALLGEEDGGREGEIARARAEGEEGDEEIRHKRTSRHPSRPPVRWKKVTRNGKYFEMIRNLCFSGLLPFLLHSTLGEASIYYSRKISKYWDQRSSSRKRRKDGENASLNGKHITGPPNHILIPQGPAISYPANTSSPRPPSPPPHPHHYRLYTPTTASTDSASGPHDSTTSYPENYAVARPRRPRSRPGRTPATPGRCRLGGGRRRLCTRGVRRMSPATFPRTSRRLTRYVFCEDPVGVVRVEEGVEGDESVGAASSLSFPYMDAFDPVPCSVCTRTSLRDALEEMVEVPSVADVHLPVPEEFAPCTAQIWRLTSLTWIRKCTSSHVRMMTAVRGSLLRFDSVSFSSFE
ncbi:hypothetical protein KC347_g289 [Hortaea werneckii]|nr:hypothetical protein KC347_g289 [Hortaea werneckii]